VIGIPRPVLPPAGARPRPRRPIRIRRLLRRCFAESAAVILAVRNKSLRRRTPAPGDTLDRSDAERVVLAIGVKPETSLAKSAGLEIGSKGGIRVDESMRTSDPHIWAVGDAVEVRDCVTGEWSFLPLAGPASRQGRIAADTICGGDSKFRGSQATAVCGCFGLTIAMTGGITFLYRKWSGMDRDLTLETSVPAKIRSWRSRQELSDTEHLVGASPQTVSFFGWWIDAVNGIQRSSSCGPPSSRVRLYLPGSWRIRLSRGGPLDSTRGGGK
jgi:hypothetical protein